MVDLTVSIYYGKVLSTMCTNYWVKVTHNCLDLGIPLSQYTNSLTLNFTLN